MTTMIIFIVNVKVDEASMNVQKSLRGAHYDKTCRKISDCILLHYFVLVLLFRQINIQFQFL